jgi:hypothetical protein
MAGIVDLVRPKSEFDPETIAVLCSALDEAWDLQSGSECARPAYARAMCEVVALARFVLLAQTPARLFGNSCRAAGASRELRLLATEKTAGAVNVRFVIGAVNFCFVDRYCRSA